MHSWKMNKIYLIPFSFSSLQKISHHFAVLTKKRHAIRLLLSVTFEHAFNTQHDVLCERTRNNVIAECRLLVVPVSLSSSCVMWRKILRKHGCVKSWGLWLCVWNYPINRIILKDFAKPKVASYHAHQNFIYKLFYRAVFELKALKAVIKGVF